MFPLLEALGNLDETELTVWCLRATFPDRDWGKNTGGPSWKMFPGNGGTSAARKLLVAGEQLELGDAVLSGLSYSKPVAHALNRSTSRWKVPFAFMAERPSVSGSKLIRVLRRQVLHHFLRGISGLVGVTSKTVTLYQEEYGYQGPAVVCPYHRDLQPFMVIHRQQEAPEDMTALVLGSLIPRKRVEDSIRAIARVRETVRLLIAGDGRERDGLEALARRIAPGRVVFLGAVPFRDVPELLSKVHMLLIPSKNDGFGMAVIEALAAGVPVIASDGTMSAHEFIEPGVNGWVVRVGDVEGYARAMASIVRDRVSWPALSQAARASLRGYDRRRDAERLRFFLERLVCGDYEVEIDGPGAS
jgi:glycosyltransferase involved in cell wall biosynthesis